MEISHPESDHGEGIHTLTSNDDLLAQADCTDEELDDISDVEEDISCDIHTHTIIFKCIGAVKDIQSQETLRMAHDRILNGYTVPVRLAPEPKNIKDSRAIAFECEQNGRK